MITIETNSILSPIQDHFTQDKSTIPAWINPVGDRIPKAFQNYKYPISAWPVVIDEDESRVLNLLSTKIPGLIDKIPALYFENDARRIADYYFEGNTMQAELALLSLKKNIEIGCRLDLSLTDTGFKVLEANIGSSVGGWEVHCFDYIIKSFHPVLNNVESDFEIQTLDTRKIYMNFIIDKVLKYSTDKKDINVFINLGKQSDTVKKDILTFFDDLLYEELIKRGLQGGAVTGDIRELKLESGNLSWQNKKVHAVLLLDLDNLEITPEVFRSFMANKIYFPDHPGLRIICDKRNLGLLRELAEQNKFSNEDNEMIIQHIPWTYAVGDKKVIFNNNTCNLIDLLKNNKDQFLIKAARGFQGIDVYAGKFLSTKEWEDVVNLSIDNQGFIVQEYCDSLDYLAPDKYSNWVPHKIIWSSFGFGKIFGGSWCRLSAVKTDVGVINSATGAVEAIVYEYRNGKQN